MLNILLLGTSNCILRHGFADGLAQSLVDQGQSHMINNLSAGASSSAYHLSMALSRKDQFSSASIIILDFIVNDCSYIRRGLLSLPDAIMTVSYLLSTVRSITDAPIIILGFHEKNEDLSIVRPYLSALIHLSEEIEAIYYPINKTLAHFAGVSLIEKEYFEDPGHIARFYSYVFGYALAFYISGSYLPGCSDFSGKYEKMESLYLYSDDAFELMDLDHIFPSNKKKSSLRCETLFEMSANSFLEVDPKICFITSLCIDARSSSALMQVTGSNQKVYYFHACFPPGPKLQVKSLHLPLSLQTFKLQILPSSQAIGLSFSPLLHSCNDNAATDGLSFINVTTVSLEAYDRFRTILLPRMAMFSLTDSEIDFYYEAWRKAFAPFMGLFDFSALSNNQYNRITFSRSIISW